MYDLLVIGGGPAGLAAASKASELGLKTAIIEKDSELGGILIQCIHDGFGTKLFGEALSGPEFAERFVERVKNAGIDIFLEAYVRRIAGGPPYELTLVTTKGVRKLRGKSILFATGCRERHWFEIGVEGDRPAGVYTAGAVQRMINLYGLLPGRRVLIVGGGDVGLIVARHLILEGAEWVMVIEIQEELAGLPRNIQQCLLDFDIPFRTRTTIKRIVGKNRVEGAIIQKVDENLRPIPGTEEFVKCDSVVFSVGLIPRTKLIKSIGGKVDPLTRGPEVNEYYETTARGAFAAGNVVTIFDFVDDAVEMAFRAAEGVSMFLTGAEKTEPVRVRPGEGMRLVVPQRIEWVEDGKKEIPFHMRVRKKIVKAYIEVLVDGEVVKRFFRPVVRPSIMEIIKLKREMVDGAKEVVFRAVPKE